MNNMLTILTLSWAICGILAYGLSYAYYFNKYKNMVVKRRHHFWLIFFGYFSLIAMLLEFNSDNGFRNIFKYGFKL